MHEPGVQPASPEVSLGGRRDEDGKVAAVCTWCHLFGIHAGRLRAVGSARQIHWEFGAPNDPCPVVDGRERRAGVRH